ncbi:hypothetical protein CXG81DRAFT_6863, partial [Caulochytrium protostelioides]
FAIVHGLKRPAVARLQNCWEALGAKHLDTFRAMDALADPAGGFRLFWLALQDHSKAAVPFLAPYLHDLMEINDNEPTYTQPATSSRADLSEPPQDTDDEDALSAILSRDVNFGKFYKLYSIVSELEAFR